jgi:hypothetical protein
MNWCHKQGDVTDIRGGGELVFTCLKVSGLDATVNAAEGDDTLASNGFAGSISLSHAAVMRKIYSPLRIDL